MNSFPPSSFGLPLVPVRAGLLLAVLAFAWPGTGLEAAPPVLDPAEDHEQPLGKYLEILRDASGERGLAEVMQSNNWETTGEYAPGFGFTRTAAWVRISLRNTAENELLRYLEVDYAPVEWIDLYVVDEAGAERFQGGAAYPFGRRAVASRTVAFPVSLPPGASRVLYMRFQSENPLNLSLRLHSWDQLFGKIKRELAVLCLYYGIIAVMLLYNLFVYISIRDRTYLYYLGYVFLFAWWHLYDFGLGHQFLWPDFPAMKQAMPYILFMSILCWYSFVRSFLSIGEHSPRLDRALFAYQVGIVLLIVLAPVLGFLRSMQTIHMLALLNGFVFTVLGVLLIRRGVPTARIFLIAFSVFLFGLIVVPLKNIGIIPTHFLSEWSLTVGSAVEVVLLSFALGHRINKLRREKEIAQAETIAALKQSDLLKDQFLSNISHELNSPIASLVLNINLLRNGDYSSGDLDASYRLLAQDTDRLRVLIANLMLAAELESDEIHPHAEPLEVGPVIDEVTDEVKTLLPHARFAVNADGVGSITSDRRLLKHVLFELARNAATYGPGETVELCAAAGPEGLRVSIRDHGPGIEPDVLRHVRTKFFRGDQSLTYVHSGVGLGLYLADRLARMLGGTLTIANRVDGQGPGLEVSLLVPDRA